MSVNHADRAVPASGNAPRSVIARTCAPCLCRVAVEEGSGLMGRQWACKGVPGDGGEPGRPACLPVSGVLSPAVFEHGAGFLEKPLVRRRASMRKQGQLGIGQQKDLPVTHANKLFSSSLPHSVGLIN